MSKTIKVSTQKLKSAKDSLSKTANLFKKAQEGQMGPDEVKEFAEEAVTVLDQAQELVETIIAEVPASVSETPLGEPGEPDLEGNVNDPDEDPERRLARRAQQPDQDPNKMGTEHDGDDPNKKGQNGEEEDEEKEEMQAKIAKLEKNFNDLQYKTAKEKIANEYAGLFQGKQKTAKFQQIMKSNDHISLLTAKLNEAKSLLGTAKMKQASSEDDSWRKPTIYSEQGKSKQASMGGEGSQRATTFANI